MKVKVKTFLCCVIVMLMLCATGCHKPSYSCYVSPGLSGVEETIILEADCEMVNIAGRSYDVDYQYSCVVENGKTTHIYSVLTGSDDDRPTIVLREDGTLHSFWNIYPFERIYDHTSLSKEQLREQVEDRLEGIVDFSVYNRYEVKGSELTWYVQREERCNIYLTIKIDEYGRICSFSRQDNCADDFTKPFLSDQQRDQMLKFALEKHHAAGKMDIDPDNIEILSQILTRRDDCNAICYTVIAIDADGWREAFVVVIVENLS